LVIITAEDRLTVLLREATDAFIAREDGHVDCRTEAAILHIVERMLTTSRTMLTPDERRTLEGMWLLASWLAANPRKT
jgi:hypothetical protein